MITGMPKWLEPNQVYRVDPTSTSDGWEYEHVVITYPYRMEAAVCWVIDALPYRPDDEETHPQMEVGVPTHVGDFLEYCGNAERLDAGYYEGEANGYW